MKLYLNTTTGLLTLTANSGSPIRRVDAKRGDSLPIEILPDTDLTGATGILAAKATYSGAPVALAPAWTPPATEGAGYLFTLDLNTTELSDLFTGETADVTLLAELTWTLSGAVRTSQTFSLVVARDVWVGTEEIPSPVLPYSSFRLLSPDESIWQISITNDGQLVRTKL